MSTTTSPVDWTIAGHSAAKVDGREFVTGKHAYSSDIRLARDVARQGAASSFVRRDLGLDRRERGQGDARCRRRPRRGFRGCRRVQARSAAARAVHAIKAEWKTGPPISSKDLFEDMKRQGRQERDGRGNSAQRTGSIEKGLNAADVRLEQTYTIAYIAHAPLEPRAAVAEWKDGKLTVWTGTQRPFGVQGELAAAFRLG